MSVVGNKQVRPAIAIVIGNRYAQAGATQGADTGIEADVGELRYGLAGVSEQLAGGAGERVRAAEVGDAFGRFAIYFWVIVEVIDNKNIQPAIAIQVDQCGRASPTQIVETRGSGGIGKLPVTGVQHQLECAKSCQQQIGFAIIVQITRSNTVIVTRKGQTTANCGINKMAGSILAK